MSSNGVRHLQCGGPPDTEGIKIPGIDIRADSTFRIAFVLTLIGMRSTCIKDENKVGGSLPFNPFLDAPESNGARMQERMHMRQCIKCEL